MSKKGKDYRWKGPVDGPLGPPDRDRDLAPGHREIRPPAGVLPRGKGTLRHGWHSEDAVQIPTSLTCNLCPLYHVKRKDRRHPLACPEGKKNQLCPILGGLQEKWAAGLLRELREVTGDDPTPSDNARIEQIIRHRSRIFQIENYLKVAGLIDLKRGEVRNVADRLTTTENALTRVLTELRQSLAERRIKDDDAGQRLEDYLRSQMARGQADDRRIAEADEAEFDGEES